MPCSPMAVESSAVAAPFIYYTGTETFPIGGFTSTSPFPSMAELRHLVRVGDFHLVLQSPRARDPRFAWIASHCLSLGSKQGAGPPGSAPTFDVFYCLPRDAPK